MESDAYSMLLKKHYDALKHLKEANVNAELLLQQRPDAFDAYVALGCANYIIGSLPGSARFMLWFGGIHGDKRLGMEQVQKTVDGGRYLKPFAQILLALCARREKQDALAQKLLKDLTKNSPAILSTWQNTRKPSAVPSPPPSARPIELSAVALDSLDDASAKVAAAQLAKDLGSDADDLRPLLITCLLESAALVWISLAVKQNHDRNFAIACYADEHSRSP